MFRTKISPGDKVVCVVPCNEMSDGVLAHWLCGAEIVQGAVYEVAEVIRDVDNFEEEGTGLILVERDTQWPRSRDGKLGAWNIGHFRPLKEADTAAAKLASVTV